MFNPSHTGGVIRERVCSLEKNLTRLPQADSIKSESKTPLFYGLSGHIDSCTNTNKQTHEHFKSDHAAGTTAAPEKRANFFFFHTTVWGGGVKPI